MSEFELRAESEMPSAQKDRSGPLTKAIRTLQPGQSVFIPWNGVPAHLLRNRLTSLISNSGLNGERGLRTGEDGIWVYVKGSAS